MSKAHPQDNAAHGTGAPLAAAPQNTFDMVTAGAGSAPDATALSFFLDVENHKRPFKWTHAEIKQQIVRAANAFYRHGLRRGDVIAMVLPNMPEAHWTIWGGEATAIVMPVNPMLEPDTIASLLKAANARAIVTLAPTPMVDLWEKVTALLPKVPSVRKVFTVSPLDYHLGVLAPILRLQARLKTPRTAGQAKVYSLTQEMRCSRDNDLVFAPPCLDDIASYFCTGGTTGAPKIAKRTHRTEVSNASMVARVLSGELNPGAVLFCGLPLFHVNAQLGSGLVPWSRGAHVVLATPQGYRGKDVIQRFWELVEHHRIVSFSGVPTVYTALMNVPVNGRSLASLKVGICGAAPLASQTIKTFEAETGVKILEGYGLTEAGCVSTLNPKVGGKAGSIGLCLPGQRLISVILDEQGRYVRDASTDEVGVLAIHGPNTFAGYLDPMHNDGIWIHRPEPCTGRILRWLNTGDLGHIDKDGFVFLNGRKKDLIIRGGHNIDPREIEEALHKHPSVAQAAAVGRPDAHLGEIPVAYIELRPGCHTDAQALAQHVATHIGERAAIPKRIHVLKALPTTAVGKVFKPDLIKLEIEDVVRTEARNANVTLNQMRIEQDPRRGFVVIYDAQDSSELLQDALSRYTFGAAPLQHTPASTPMSLI